MTAPPPDDSQKWSRALDRWIEGELPADEARELQQRMKADAALLFLYLEKMRLHSLLRDRAWPKADEEEAPAPAPRPIRRRTVPPRWLMLAAAACVALMLAPVVRHRFGKPAHDAPPADAASPALQFSASSVFSTPGAAASADGRLAMGDAVVMQDGSVSIRMPGGVEAVLRSPSRFAITSANRLKLDQGAGWFRVPPQARGFTVDLPAMEVVDLGTVFTASVNDDEQQVQVEQGRVEVRQRRGDMPMQMLKAGERLVRQAHADTVRIVAGSSLLNPEAMNESAEIIFHEDLTQAPDQPFTTRQPFKGTWQVREGAPEIREGRFAARSSFTHLMGRFTRAVEPEENAFILVTFKSVSPSSLFHSRGFAGVSLFDGAGEMFFLGDKSSDSYSWELLVYGRAFWKKGGNPGRRAFDLAIQGSEETFTMRYRQRTGAFEVFRGRGVRGLPLVQGKTDPGLRIDALRIANGRGGDFSFEDIEVSVVKDGGR